MTKRFASKEKEKLWKEFNDCVLRAISDVFSQVIGGKENWAVGLDVTQTEDGKFPVFIMFDDKEFCYEQHIVRPIDTLRDSVYGRAFLIANALKNHDFDIEELIEL